ncbi:Uncharacterized protein APZ42_017048 [Daphnia magna]|uniref:Uncharacterized protein n=1 Tax=Daphnia magna TaxID=35525 RepID=A0A165AB06_9CRUS|nr:Uncharacterized protein APZ42_017048 [Daphnia magna]
MVGNIVTEWIVWHSRPTACANQMKETNKSKMSRALKCQGTFYPESQDQRGRLAINHQDNVVILSSTAPTVGTNRNGNYHDCGFPMELSVQRKQNALASAYLI